MKYADMKLKDLKNLALACFDAVNVIECYGMKDLMNLEGSLRELENRGYQVDCNKRLSIYKN